MPGSWTLEQGITFAKHIVAECGSRVSQEPFVFHSNEAVPEDWTEEDVKKLNRVVWALVNTPLTWEAIEYVWTVSIMPMDSKWRESLNASSDPKLPHLLDNFFSWLWWDTPEEGTYVPGLTFRIFIEDCREVVVRTFGNDALRQEEEAAMTEFVNIWLKGRHLKAEAPAPLSEDPHFRLYAHFKTELITDKQRAEAAQHVAEFLAIKARREGPTVAAEWPVPATEAT
ncbi:hypothetical protein C8Q72DRAFT_889799 [Fomitopsis betulina]|nr:hypothetical protein C8Q72DRAFT_889799 [Fomitopsis betulina]